MTTSWRLDSIDDLGAVERVDHVQHLGLLCRTLERGRLDEAEPRGGRGARARTAEPERHREQQTGRTRVPGAGTSAGAVRSGRASRLAGSARCSGSASGHRRVPAPRRSGGSATWPWPSGRSSPDRKDLVDELAGREWLVLQDLKDQHPPVPLEWAARRSGARARRERPPGCRYRSGHRPAATRPAPVRATCKRASPAPRPPGSSTSPRTRAWPGRSP